MYSSIVSDSWRKVGLSFGSFCQQLFIISLKKLGEYSGFSIRYPFWISLLAKSFSHLDMGLGRGKIFPTREFRRTRHPIGWKIFYPSGIRWPSTWLVITPILSSQTKSSLLIARMIYFRLPYFSLFLVIIVRNLSGHSEIGHFDNTVIGQ